MNSQASLPRTLSSLDPQRWPPFFILGGAQRESARPCILWLLQKALCTNSLSSNHASSGCVECRQIEKQEHNELLWIENPSKKIKLDDLEGLSEHLSVSPLVHGSKRCAVLMDFEGLTPSAAAHLLKTLEELPKQALVIAYSKAPLKILATLRSRGPIYRLVSSPSLENAFSQDLRDATRLLLKSTPDIQEISDTWGAIARSKSFSLEEFFTVLEFELNEEYKRLLGYGIEKLGPRFVLTQRRRRTVSDLRNLALGKGISLNLRACAEQIALAGG